MAPICLDMGSETRAVVCVTPPITRSPILNSMVFRMFYSTLRFGHRDGACPTFLNLAYAYIPLLICTILQIQFRQAASSQYSLLYALLCILSACPRLLVLYSFSFQFISSYKWLLVARLNYLSGACQPSYYLVDGGGRAILEEYPHRATTRGNLIDVLASGPSLGCSRHTLVQEEDASQPVAQLERGYVTALESSGDAKKLALGVAKEAHVPLVAPLDKKKENDTSDRGAKRARTQERVA